jgi:hypothetical protein
MNEDEIKERFKRRKIQRGTYLYTCRTCFEKTMFPEDHLKWVHNGLQEKIKEFEKI